LTGNPSHLFDDLPEDVGSDPASCHFDNWAPELLGQVLTEYDFRLLLIALAIREGILHRSDDIMVAETPAGRRPSGGIRIGPALLAMG
jgi:hypothetical protein